jgi:DNA invertase Pin-like site-specific DNA recombinase
VAPKTPTALGREDLMRFARSVSHLLRALDTFRALGIEFVSLSESLDTATPEGRMVFTVLGAVAELERSLIAERLAHSSRQKPCRSPSHNPLRCRSRLSVS